MAADLSRSLNTWHHHVARAPNRLERKGVVKPSGFIGENMDRSMLLRKSYSLNPEVVNIAIPVPKVDVERLRQEAADAQDRGMLIEAFCQASARFGSHDAIKRYMGREQLLRLKAMVEDRLQSSGAI